MSTVQISKPGDDAVRHVFQETSNKGPEFRTWFRGEPGTLVWTTAEDLIREGWR